MTLILRPTHPTDRDALWDMLRPVFRAGDTYAIDPEISKSDALTYWTSHASFIVGDATPRGTFYVRPNQPGGGAHVCNAGFITASGNEGRGVAQRMLHHALESARSMGFLAMQFNFVLDSNTRALGLWRKAGFAQIGRQPRAFRLPDGTLVDALILHKFL
jgi:ribosomal protein S18 acetylase RimI-like enzyme